jgi:hypothetical protein
MVNQGPEMHHVQLVKIEAGHTVKEYLDRLAAGELQLAWVRYVGGPSVPNPGETSEVTLDLEEGGLPAPFIRPVDAADCPDPD